VIKFGRKSGGCSVLHGAFLFVLMYVMLMRNEQLLVLADSRQADVRLKPCTSVILSRSLNGLVARHN
jgi:hypothetical protein